METKRVLAGRELEEWLKKWLQKGDEYAAIVKQLLAAENLAQIKALTAKALALIKGKGSKEVAKAELDLALAHIETATKTQPTRAQLLASSNKLLRRCEEALNLGRYAAAQKQRQREKRQRQRLIDRARYVALSEILVDARREGFESGRHQGLPPGRLPGETAADEKRRVRKKLDQIIDRVRMRC